MEVGDVISNQYQVIEHIGRGGMADVWSARDQRLNRMVAIKTIAHGLSQEIDPVKLFEQEAKTIAQMEHPHILPIYDFGDHEHSLYIVMRYVTGGSLEDLLSTGAMRPAEVLQTGQAIAQALDHAHTNNVIHLDLKPPNILLDSSNSPYLADFGLATVLDPQGRARNPGSGTLLYMAPEQLVAETIDHRADIYSFTIVIFHMLTGQLPFEGAIPLALQQMQYQEELPELDSIKPELPAPLTDILRRGVAVEVNHRPTTMMEIIQEMREVFSGTSDLFLAGEGLDDDFETDSFAAVGMSTEPIINLDDAGLLEAADIYSRARHAWAGGQGRFLLGISHFMLMSGYYMDAEAYGLPLDEAGRQMLLRGALEYDHEVEFWWSQVDDENRRWVCLHAVRSENAAARRRALYRLETLPDADQQPVIPQLVASALEIENNEDARLAALQVLGTRAHLLKPQQEVDIQSQYRGRMLTTMTRLDIQIGPPRIWQEAIYSPEIDLLIAETALDPGMPKVAEFAARIIGRIHSLTAVRHIADEQRIGRHGALRALAFIRDEAPALPPVVSRQARLYAWLTNTVRRLTDNPFDLILRFVLAVLGGWLAMGEHVYITFRSQALFTPQRWGNTIAIGLVFGLLVGILVILADDFSRRLRGFWPWWARALVFGLLGVLIGILTWASFTWFFLNSLPEWDLMRFAGTGLALGFIIGGLLNLRGWLAFPLTVVAIYVPVYLAFQDFWYQELQVSASRQFILFYDDVNQLFTVAIPFALVIALGGHAQGLFASLRRFIGEPSRYIERRGWLVGMLIYTMIGSALVSVLAIFSAHADVVWALGWTLWGLLTFVFAVATWQWRKWGAYGLLASGIALLVGGFLKDGLLIKSSLDAGEMPVLFTGNAPLLWAVWAIWIATFGWAAIRQRLWGGLGLLGMTLLWIPLVLLSEIPDSIAPFAITNAALLFYALAPSWKSMESGKRKIKKEAVLPTIAMPPRPLAEVGGAVVSPEKTADVDMQDLQPAGELETEFDVSNQSADESTGFTLDTSQVQQRSADMKTELDVGFATDLETEQDTPGFTLDTSHVRKRSDHLETEPDVSLDTEQEPTAEFTLDTSQVRQRSDNLNTELDVGYTDDEGDDKDDEE